MRRILFRLMILIVLFLLIVLAVAARQHTSPKMVIQNRFMRDAITISTGDDLPTQSVIPIVTGDASTKANTGTLTDEEKQQTHDFVNSLIQK